VWIAASVAAAFCLWAGLVLFAQSQETYQTRLSAVAADQKSRADIAGIGSASAVLSGSKLTVTGTFEGLKTPATVARLHNGVAPGARGPAIHDLTITRVTSGTIGGSVDLSAQHTESLRKGNLYIQVHSEKPPDGTLWGWLLK
jgi:hypothetical protein